MAFIIDTYNRYDQFDREKSRYVFEVNGGWYAVKEVEVEWGQPVLPPRIGQEKDPKQYFIYESFESAMRFVHAIKSLN